LPAAADTPVVKFVSSPKEQICAPMRTRFGAARTPPGCWRPYARTSPFNTPLPADPRVAPRSDAIVGRLVGFGPLQHLEAGHDGGASDYGHPTYWSRPDDPLVRLHCTRRWGRCELEGRSIRIPRGARPAGGDDGHMTVVDQERGWEYDLYDVEREGGRGNVLRIGWGGRTGLYGTGLGSHAVASGFGSLAGIIRAEELLSGQVQHALFLVVHCDSGSHVYPAVKSGASCASAGEPNEGAPPMGTRLQLDMSEAEIAALDAPYWRKAIFRAMARYGMFVGDTGSGSWSLKEESGLTYTSFGAPDRWLTLAREARVPRDGTTGLHVFNVRDGIDWKSRLRVIDPCETLGTCRVR
jgi:hypothetical protein